MDSFADLPPVIAPPEHHAGHPTSPFSTNGAHPPYAEMITAAIVGLKDKDGSSRQTIAKYIEKEFLNLPPTHPTLLTHHLKRMKNEGQLTMVKHSYILTPPRSLPFQPSLPLPTMDHHFTDYTVTATVENSSLTPRRKPGRPPKPRHDFGFQPPLPLPEIQSYEPQFEQSRYDGGGAQPIFASLGLADDGVPPPPPPPPPPENVVVSVKRGRGRPPKAAMVNGSGVKRGRPRRIGGTVSVPLSENVTGRPKRNVSRRHDLSDIGGGGDFESGSVSKGRGRPRKNKFGNSTARSYGRPSKVGPGTAVLVTDPHQLVAYQELKFKFQNLQSKAKEVMGVIRPYINPEYKAFGALQDLEMLVTTNVDIQSEI